MGKWGNPVGMWGNMWGNLWGNPYKMWGNNVGKSAPDNVGKN